LSAAIDGTSGATVTIMIASKATWIFIRRSPPNQLGADTSLRLGDLTLRKLHYQTGLTNRQPLAKPRLIATINRA
jgi:hypothetical protein